MDRKRLIRYSTLLISHYQKMNSNAMSTKERKEVADIKDELHSDNISDFRLNEICSMFENMIDDL